MISSLTGIVQSCESNLVTLDVHGVGYEVFCTSGCLSNLLDKSSAASVASARTVLIYTDIKEDSIRLYGFADRLEKQIFILLLRVKGVGSKTACDMLSKVDKRDLLRFVAQGDVTNLQKIKGVGKKTAERVVLELRDIMIEYSREQADFAQALGADLDGGLGSGRSAAGVMLQPEAIRQEEASQALIALGLQARDAQAMLQQALKDDTSLLQADVAEMIKAALKYI